MIGNGPPISKFGAVPVVALANEKVLQGVTFSWAKRFTLAGLATANIVIDTSNVDVEKLVVVLPLSFQAIGGGPIFIDLHVDVDSDEDGTKWDGVNRNNVIGGDPQTVVRLNPTLNDPGVKTPSEFMIPSDGIAAVATVGGQTRDDLVFNALKTKYMLKVMNQENVAVDLTLAMSIFEV